jgi:SAM-dependent methyltransferase
MPRLGALADAAARMGLGDVALAARDQLQAILHSERVSDAYGVLPPASLRMATVGSTDWSTFSEIGDRTAELLVRIALHQGQPIGQATRVLDFGCGCGRVARPFLARTGALMTGCDVQPRMVDWCRKNLPGEWRVTQNDPPLPFEAEAFDVVYALSVFTHLPDTAARGWLAELARVTKPGGVALLTILDERHPAAEPFREQLTSDGYALKRDGAQGRNMMIGLFSQAGFAARAAPGWRMAECLSAEETGIGQSVAVLRRV